MRHILIDSKLVYKEEQENIAREVNCNKKKLARVETNAPFNQTIDISMDRYGVFNLPDQLVWLIKPRARVVAFFVFFLVNILFINLYFSIRFSTFCTTNFICTQKPHTYMHVYLYTSIYSLHSNQVRRALANVQTNWNICELYTYTQHL